jgi:hypothetical protein
VTESTHKKNCRRLLGGLINPVALRLLGITNLAYNSLLFNPRTMQLNFWEFAKKIRHNFIDIGAELGILYSL